MKRKKDLFVALVMIAGDIKVFAFFLSDLARHRQDILHDVDAMESPNYEISSLCSTPLLDGKDFLGHIVNAFVEDDLFDFVDNSEISFPHFTGEPDRKYENEGGKSLLRAETSTVDDEQTGSHYHARKEHGCERYEQRLLGRDTAKQTTRRISHRVENTASSRTSTETAGFRKNSDDNNVGRKSLNASTSAPNQTEGCEENAAQIKANNILSSAGDSKAERIKLHSTFSPNYIPKKIKERNLFPRNKLYERQTVSDNLHIRANSYYELQPKTRRLRFGKTDSSDFSLTNSTPKRGLIQKMFYTSLWKADKTMTKPFELEILNTPRNMDRRLNSCKYSQTHDPRRDSKKSKTSVKVKNKCGGLYLSNCMSCFEEQRNPRKTHRQVNREDRMTLTYDTTSPGCISLPSINTSLTKRAYRKAAFHETLCKYSNTSSVAAIEALISRYTKQHQDLAEQQKKGEI